MAQLFDLKKNNLKVKVLNDCTHVAHSEGKRDTNSGLSHCRMYQDKLASLKRQLQQLQEGNHFFFSYDFSVS